MPGYGYKLPLEIFFFGQIVMYHTDDRSKPRTANWWWRPFPCAVKQTNRPDNRPNMDPHRQPSVIN